jgi:hypothetical protein
MAAQLCGMLFIIGWTSAIMIPFFWLINRLGILRVTLYEEEVGLDIIHHKGHAYNFRYNSSKHALDAGVCALPLSFQSRDVKQGDGVLEPVQSNQT